MNILCGNYLLFFFFFFVCGNYGDGHDRDTEYCSMCAADPVSNKLAYKYRALGVNFTDCFNGQVNLTFLEDIIGRRLPRGETKPVYVEL